MEQKTLIKKQEIDENYCYSGAVYIRSGCSYAPSITGIVSTKKVPKKICPCCNQQTLTPYYCLVHSPSGAHIIKFYCENCKKKIAFNNIYGYYKLLKKYLMDYGLWYHTSSYGDFSFKNWLSYSKRNTPEGIKKIKKEIKNFKNWLKSIGIKEKK